MRFGRWSARWVRRCRGSGGTCVNRVGSRRSRGGAGSVICLWTSVRRSHAGSRLAQLEGGIKVLITDCVGTLSPVKWYLDGRAAGFFVGVYRAALDADGAYIALPDQFAYAYSETAPPTAEAIGDLVQEALENATILFLHDQIAKGGRRHA
jgi:hypothetical protein